MGGLRRTSAAVVRVKNLRKIYVQGSTRGTDPNDPEYWGKAATDYDQALCEMAAIAVGLLLAPESYGSRYLQTRNQI